MPDDNPQAATPDSDALAPDAPAPIAVPGGDHHPAGPETVPADPFEAMREKDPGAADALRQDWGADFDTNIGYARDAANAFADAPLREFFEEYGLGDDPRIVRVAAEIGRMLNDGSLPGGRRQPQAGDGTRRALENELEKLVASSDYWSDKVQRRVQQIYVTLYGDAPIPVHRNRSDAAGRH